MHTEFYFVRHAKPNYNNHNDMLRELNEQGLADRRLVTEYLRDKQIDVILSSPYKRAVDTIRPFAEACGLEIRIIDDFRERLIDSEWIPDFEAFARKQWADFDYKLSDGESLSEVQSRNIAALHEAGKTYQGQRIVVGSHGTALSTIINHFEPSFGYEDFVSIKNLMPWIVHFVFEGDTCIQIEKINLFT